MLKMFVDMVREEDVALITIRKVIEIDKDKKETIITEWNKETKSIDFSLMLNKVGEFLLIEQAGISSMVKIDKFTEAEGGYIMNVLPLTDGEEVDY